MKSRLRPHLTFALLMLTVLSVSAQELPRKDGAGDFDFEPKLMLNDLAEPSLPNPLEQKIPADSAADVARLESEIKRAQKTEATRWRLFKSGVLSKLEAEQSSLKVVRLTAEFENARLRAAHLEIEMRLQETAPDTTPIDAQANAEAALTAIAQRAQEATKKWSAAQRQAAELRVERARKLLAAGIGSRSAVKRAESALLDLPPSNR